MTRALAQRLSSHELAQGYQETEDPSITVRFKVGGCRRHLFPGLDNHALDAAIKPALAVGDDIDYDYCEHEGQTLIVAEALREAVFRDAEHNVLKNC